MIGAGMPILSSMRGPSDITLPSAGDLLLSQPLLALALVSILLVVGGNLFGLATRRGGAAVRTVGHLGIAAALVLTIVNAARLNPDLDLAMPQIGMPEQIVEGSETRIPLSRDGHFWVEGQVNGAQARFLIDTGATLTALSTAAAAAGRVEPIPYRQPVIMRTANGNAPAQLATIDILEAGSVTARDLDVVVSPAIGNVNVLGMNFLSRLDSWRVEDDVLILVPES